MMTVLEYAQDLKRSVTDVLAKCKELNIKVKSQDDYLDEDAITILDNYFANEVVDEDEVIEEKINEKYEGLSEDKKEKKGKKSKKIKETDKEETKKLKKEMYKNKEKLISNVPSAKAEEVLDDDTIWYEEGMTVGELADSLNIAPVSVIKSLMGLGKMATINNTIDYETAEIVALENNKLIAVKKQQDAINFEDIEIDDDASMLVERPAVVTIMGHVDHGKTTLLDTIRKSHVTEGEFGGITQHIGAYQVEYKGKKITFLDTPGHEAFTQMRARGASVTDIVIIVVAADDGVMPQTREAIDHAKAANVPIIVAVNKMDKPEANPDRVMTELSNFDLVPEAWGGSTIFTNVSAKFGKGIDELLENILLISEVSELKANPHRYSLGTVIEAELDKGRGPVATLLVQNGTLRVGDPVVVGNAFGRIRSMVNDLGKELVEALPSQPVEITGLNLVPSAGDKFMAFDSEKTARSVADKRLDLAKVNERKSSSAMSLDELFSQIQEGEVKEINVILKADVQGSSEAVKASLERIDVEGVRVKVIRSSVGAITESDILLAAASKAVIIGFNVRPDARTREAAERENVDIRLHNIIYKVVEEMEAAMNGMLDPVFKEVVTGQVVVRETFKISKVGTIAGCFVTDGLIKRDCGIRLIRDGIVIYEGELGSLKRFKDDVKEVKAGYECGIMISNFNDIKVDDIIEGYVMEEEKRK